MRWAFVAVVTIAAASFCGAQQSPSDVAFAGEHFFRFRVAAGRLSPEERASVMQERLTQVFTNLYARGALPTVSIRYHGGWATVWVTGVLFATVTVNDARANGTTVRNLVQTWSQRTARALRTILPTPKMARSPFRPVRLTQAR